MPYKNEFPLCEACIFWDQLLDVETRGRCRFNPTVDSRAGWPTTNYNDWCGKAVSREITFSTPKEV